MDANEALAERFEEHRIRLWAVAYRMLGSLSEADDAVQEAWLRLSGAEAKDVENLAGSTPSGWSMTQTSRTERRQPGGAGWQPIAKRLSPSSNWSRES
jgi:DNA-directed RNA polymerase specialized sigma24 family protein